MCKLSRCANVQMTFCILELEDQIFYFAHLHICTFAHLHIILTMSLENRIKQVIRDIPDFPIPGIIFKDITPILKEPELCKEISTALCNQLKHYNADAIVAMDSRGFWFGLMMATHMGIP